MLADCCLQVFRAKEKGGLNETEKNAIVSIGGLKTTAMVAGQANDYFGFAVDVCDGVLIVGADSDDDGAPDSVEGNRDENGNGNPDYLEPGYIGGGGDDVAKRAPEDRHPGVDEKS